MGETERPVPAGALGSPDGLPAMDVSLSKLRELVMDKEAWQSLGWEDPLEKGMATHSSILAWSPLSR